MLGAYFEDQDAYMVAINIYKVRMTLFRHIVKQLLIFFFRKTCFLLLINEAKAIVLKLVISNLNKLLSIVMDDMNSAFAINFLSSNQP